ncbi:MAG: hypothetical protein AAGA48_17655 [Myxococcota bacterium]
MFLWLAAAFAAPPKLNDVNQQIIVWGDPFLRWDQRFYVETELHPVAPLRIPAFRNTELRLTAVQVRAVLACSRLARQGKHQLEVRCRIEDIGLQGRPHPKDKLERHARVLPEVDATLTGIEIELQVTDKGRVFSVGLDGFETTTLRTRQREEVLRQIAWRLIAPFDLKLPEPIRPWSQWTTNKTALFAWPTKDATRGGIEVVHTMSPYDGHLVVQTVGRSTIEDGGVTIEMLGGDEQSEFRDLGQLRFNLQLDGVTVIDPTTGILSDRVYTVQGAATSSSGAAIAARKHSQTGRIRMLGAGDRPDVGPSVLRTAESWQPLGIDGP